MRTKASNYREYISKLNEQKNARRSIADNAIIDSCQKSRQK